MVRLTYNFCYVIAITVCNVRGRIMTKTDFRYETGVKKEQRWSVFYQKLIFSISKS